MYIIDCVNGVYLTKLNWMDCLGRSSLYKTRILQSDCTVYGWLYMQGSFCSKRTHMHSLDQHDRGGGVFLYTAPRAGWCDLPRMLCNEANGDITRWEGDSARNKQKFACRSPINLLLGWKKVDKISFQKGHLGLPGLGGTGWPICTKLMNNSQRT